jgi:hypothetical protein
MAPRTLILIAAFICSIVPVEAQQNCETALARAARKAADQAKAERAQTLCRGLSWGLIAYDKTRKVELKSLSVCEAGDVVTASATVELECGTSDKAVIRDSLSDTVTVTLNASLKACTVEVVQLRADKLFGKVALSLTGDGWSPLLAYQYLRA